VLGVVELDEGTVEFVESVSSKMRLVLLAADPHPAMVYEAIEKGAVGFLSRTCEEREICLAIAAVARGREILSPDIQAAYVSEIRLRAHDGDTHPTPREQEILGL
jgi:two-component system nitrate/nitrite response regulator NarL